MRARLERPVLGLALALAVSAALLARAGAAGGPGILPEVLERLAAQLPWPALLYGGESLLAALATWLDKRAAGRERPRWSEASLHLLELLGGWPGALLAQRLARHKTRKLSYRLVLWAIALVHLAGWAFWLSIP